MNNIEHDYLKLLNDIMVNGVTKSDRTGTGTISVFGRQIRHKMSEGFPLLTTKKMPFKTIATELLWFLRGDTNIKFLVDNNCHIWDGDAYKAYEQWYADMSKTTPFEVPRKFTQDELIKAISLDEFHAKQFGDLGPIYGKQWRSWGTNKYDVIGIHKVDQIQNLINDLKSNPDSRRLMVNAWNVGELDQMVLPPCHYGFQVYTRELCSGERRDWVIKNRSQQMPKFFDRLGWEGNVAEVLENFNTPTRAISLMWNQRSVDTPLGLPFNIASYALLLELLAMEVNMIPDQLIGNLGDCHIYLNQTDGVKEQLTRIPMSLGKLVINDEFWNPGAGVFNQQDLRPTDFYVDGYESHPKINFPLSN